MTKIPAIAFAGFSGAGKTTLIERIVRELKARGMRVAVVKHDGHRFEIDHEGKDSWRFAQAGADLVAVSSAEQTACIERRNLSLWQILDRIHQADLILVEGYKNEDLPQIGVARAAAGKGFTADLRRFAAVVTDMEVDAPAPCFGLDDIPEITEFILELVGRPAAGAGMRPAAVAAGRILVNQTAFAMLQSGGIGEGGALTIAQIAGAMGAGGILRPPLTDGVGLSLRLDRGRCSIEMEATAPGAGCIDAEREALAAVFDSALTICGLCRAVQRDMIISDVRLVGESGGMQGG